MKDPTVLHVNGQTFVREDKVREMKVEAAESLLQRAVGLMKRAEAVVGDSVPVYWARHGSYMHVWFLGLGGMAYCNGDTFDPVMGMAVAMLKARVSQVPEPKWHPYVAFMPIKSFAQFIRVRDAYRADIAKRQFASRLPARLREFYRQAGMDAGETVFLKARALVRLWETNGEGM